MEEQEILCKIS